MNVTDPVDVLARTLWGEARGEGAAGMAAVASVVCNRANHPRWWGHGVLSVCLEPYQFSSWNENDPNRAKLESVTSADPAFASALQIAATAVAGKLPDTTAGSDSYFAIGSPTPSWATRAKWARNIGRHAFYRIELPAPSGLPEAPCIHAPPAPPTADELMAAELNTLQGDAT